MNASKTQAGRRRDRMGLAWFAFEANEVLGNPCSVYPVDLYRQAPLRAQANPKSQKGQTLRTLNDEDRYLGTPWQSQVRRAGKRGLKCFFPLHFGVLPPLYLPQRALFFAAPVGNLLKREPFHAVPAKPAMSLPLPSLAAVSIQSQYSDVSYTENDP
jgi:hypothetical protein